MVGNRKASHRRVLAVFVLSVFGYLLLVLIGPFLFGPWVLVVAAGIGAVVVMAARSHAHGRGRRPHADLRLGWGRRGRPADTSLSKEVALTFLLGTFAGVLLALGVYIQTRYSTNPGEGAMYLLGGGIVQLAIWIGLAILSEGDPRYALGVPFLVDDTMDDH